MFLSFFIHSNQLFQIITQSFYIVLSHINIRTRNKISAGVLIIRRRINYRRGRGCQKNFDFFSKKSHSAENCRTVPKMSIPYLYTLPNTLGSCPKPKNCRQPIRIEYYVIRVKHPSTSSANQNRVLRNPSRQPIRIEYHSAEKHPRAFG